MLLKQFGQLGLVVCIVFLYVKGTRGLTAEYNVNWLRVWGSKDIL